MTDTAAFLSTIVTSDRNFIDQLETQYVNSDRIEADSSMATKLAEQAVKSGRPDLVAADFDNYKACVDLVRAVMNAKNGDTIQVNINTGGTVKLGLYKII